MMQCPWVSIGCAAVGSSGDIGSPLREMISNQPIGTASTEECYQVGLPRNQYSRWKCRRPKGESCCFKQNFRHQANTENNQICPEMWFAAPQGQTGCGP